MATFRVVLAVEIPDLLPEADVPAELGYGLGAMASVVEFWGGSSFTVVEVEETTVDRRVFVRRVAQVGDQHSRRMSKRRSTDR